MIAYRMEALDKCDSFSRSVWYPGQEGNGQLFVTTAKRTPGFRDHQDMANGDE